MKNPFEKTVPGLTASAIGAYEINPSDIENVAVVTRRIHIGSGGDLHVQLLNGSEVTYKNLLTGSSKEIFVTKVFQTNTTADLLIGEY